MTQHRLLMVTYHFPPSSAVGGHRLLGFSRYLPSLGWSCSVVAPSGLPWEPSDPELERQVTVETRVYRPSYPTGRIIKPLRYLGPYAVWLPWAWHACCRALRHDHPDVVLTSGPPHVVHLLGLWFRRWHGLPWVADFRDPWISGDLSAQCPKFGRWEPRAEAAVMRRADAIIANTPRAREQLATAYPEHAAKMVAITNGYDPEMFSVNPVPPCSRDVAEIVHAGQVYANRDPAPLFEAIRAIATEESPGGRSLQVRFMGCEGEGRPEVIRRLAHDARVSQAVSVVGMLPHAEAIGAMRQADILLLLDSPGRMSGVPAKLFEYLGAGRPILALAEPESDVDWVLRQSGRCYRIAPPRDPLAIRRALVELTRESTSFSTGPAGRGAAVPFTRATIATELAHLLDACVDARPRLMRANTPASSECVP